MANTNVLGFQSKVAGADLSAHQYKFVVLNSSGEAILNTTAGGLCYGVLQNTPLEDDPAAILPIGSTGKGKVLLGETVAVNDPITSNATGLAVIADTSTNVILGYMLEAGASGEYAEFTPAPAGRLVP